MFIATRSAPGAGATSSCIHDRCEQFLPEASLLQLRQDLGDHRSGVSLGRFDGTISHEAPPRKGAKKMCLWVTQM